MEYEQNGKDRAEYGKKLFQNLAERLTNAGIKGLPFTTLHLCKQFYGTYPQIIQAASEYFQLPDLQESQFFRRCLKNLGLLDTPTAMLLTHLSFSHFIELFKADDPLKRIFYETQSIRNNWSVRELRRAMNSMLFERTGLSKDKKALFSPKAQKGFSSETRRCFPESYILDFLGLKEKPNYVESDLEQAIIDHLQAFPGNGQGVLLRSQAATNYARQYTLSDRPGLLSSYFKMSCPAGFKAW